MCVWHQVITSTFKRYRRNSPGILVTYSLFCQLASYRKSPSVWHKVDPHFTAKGTNKKSRPCGFGQSLGRPIVRSFSHFFWSTKKKLSSLREFLGSLWEFLVDQKKFWYTKKKFGQPKIPRDWPKIPWDWTIFFWSTKKMRKRPDNWSTKRLTKTTWTGLLFLVIW